LCGHGPRFLTHVCVSVQLDVWCGGRGGGGRGGGGRGCGGGSEPAVTASSGVVTTDAVWRLQRVRVAVFVERCVCLWVVHPRLTL
jgi:hypothetical protein